jgi:2-oxoglutarate dehydrogenase E1 component
VLGKVAYDLMEAREKERLEDVSIVRLEQLYPFPGEPLRGAPRADDQPRGSRLVPGGAEEQRRLVLRRQPDRGRADRSRATQACARATPAATAASPATGLASRHKEQQEAVASAGLA